MVGLHGGGYVLKPSIFHWLDYAAMARDTGATVVVPIYPLAPQGTAATVVPQIADLISAQIDQHGAENVSVYGDSAGGGLALAAVQELVRRGDPVPSHMVLISPALDVTLSDPASQTIDDPVSECPLRCKCGGGSGPATSTWPIRGSARCSGHWLGCRRPRSTPGRWICSLPRCFASRAGLGERAPTSRSYSGKVKYTTGRSSASSARGGSPFAQTFINS